MTDDPFQERPDHELHALSDEELIAYIRAAHRAGRRDAGKRGLAIAVYGHWERIKFRVARKIPAAEVEDVTAAVVESAVAAAFMGDSPGELHAFMNRITARRIADYHKRKRHRTRPLPEPDEEDGPWGEEPSEASEAGAVEARMVIEDLLAELSPDHRRVVELYVIACRSAAETAAQVDGMTEANVHQIGSRFRARLSDELAGGDTSE